MIGRRNRLFFAILFGPLLLLLLGFGLAEYRKRAFDAAWQKVRPDMSQEEVRQLLGEPDNIYGAGTPAPSNSVVGNFVASLFFDFGHEKWAYGRRRLVAIEPGYVGPAFDGLLVPEDGDYVIYFSQGGSVISKKYPYSGPPLGQVLRSGK
jgi:hypothetical protein